MYIKEHEMKRAYFIDTELPTGEWVTVIYESESKKGTFNNWCDLYFTAQEKGLQIDDRDTCNAYLMNEKNMREQCFGYLGIIDIR